MTTDKDKEQKRAANGDGGEEEQARQHPGSEGDWEDELAVYPLRPPQEDPAWAVITVKIWLWLAVLTGLFVLALVILGFFYD